MTIAESIRNSIRRLAGTRTGEFILDCASFLRQFRRGFSPADGYPFETIKLLKPLRVRVEAKDYAPEKAPRYAMVTPVKNEAEGIESFMRSVEAQTAPPAEAIIVDGGSSDSTVRIMKKFAAASKIRFTILEIRSTSISSQRNLGVKKASTDIIVFADAGCELDPRYGANLSASLAAHPRAGLAGGIFFASPRTLANRFEFAWDSLARWNRYLPAGKCMAVRRGLFLSIGGFAEHLPYSGEDYLFDVTIRRSCREWVINRNAFVTWHVPSTMAAARKKYRSYGKGDGQNGLGDYIHFRQMREYADTGRIAHDELGSELFRGYLEGRKDRPSIETGRRKIRGVVIVIADGLLTSAPFKKEKLSLAKELTGKNMKVIYVAAGKLKPALPRFIDADMSLVELYTEENVPVQQIKAQYAAMKGDFFLYTAGEHASCAATRVRKCMPGIETISFCG